MSMEADVGLFDFVKEAGRKLSGGDDESEAVEEYIAEKTKGNALWRLVKDLGLEVEDLHVEFDDGIATVTGTAASQAEREKVVLALGNTRGVGRVDDRMEVASPEPEAAFYTVKSGDTLSKIARDHYGDAMRYPVIFEANRPMLTDPDLIYPGQVLRLPPEAD